MNALFEHFGIELPEREYVFAPPRKWRFDYCWRKQKLALEVEGGTWISGRHNRGKGFLRDMEKYNAAAAMGWRVLRVTPQQLESQDTYEMILNALTDGARAPSKKRTSTRKESHGISQST